jgi:hypothetical protein
MKSEEDRYQEYLCSREWGVLKELVRERSGGQCERCSRNEAYAVHHVTYIRKYHELPEDLQHLCEACHNFIHGKSNFDPCETLSNQIQCGRDGLLTCPYCEAEESYLHHDYIIVYDRDGEDGDVLETVFDANGIINKQEQHARRKSNNPSSRRDGVAIGFWCELCAKTTELTIEQHKGQTYLGWRRATYKNKHQMYGS